MNELRLGENKSPSILCYIELKLLRILLSFSGSN